MFTPPRTQDAAGVVELVEPTEQAGKATSRRSSERICAVRAGRAICGTGWWLMCDAFPGAPHVLYDCIIRPNGSVRLEPYGA